MVSHSKKHRLLINTENNDLDCQRTKTIVKYKIFWRACIER